MVLLSSERVRSLLETYGSPLYVYDSDRLHDTIDRITKSLAYPNTCCHFACVTNGNVALLRIFKECGWGLHANTPGDAYLGLQAGFAPERIVYSGSNLHHSEMAQILEWGVKTLNLDSLTQLAQLASLAKGEASLRVGLRLNLPSLTGHSRIGVRPEEFPEAVAIARRGNLRVTGLHFYRGTGTNATEAFTSTIQAVTDTAAGLPDWEYLDFGGGFGHPYRHAGIAFDWDTFGRELHARIETVNRTRDRPIALIVEPGRAAIAGCAVLLATVVAVKWQGKKQIVGVDTTVGNLAVPSVHGGYREIACVHHEKGEDVRATMFVTDVCGNTTYSRDYLGRNCRLPALETGDVLAIQDVGAYGYAMSSHFLHRPRPAEVLLEQGSDRLIRQREDFNVLIANQVLGLP